MPLMGREADDEEDDEVKEEEEDDDDDDDDEEEENDDDDDEDDDDEGWARGREGSISERVFAVAERGSGVLHCVLIALV